MHSIDHGGDTLSDLSDLSAEMPDEDSVAARTSESAARIACRHASNKLKASSGPRETRSVSQGKRRPGLRGRMPMSRSPSPGKRPEIRDPVPLGPVADGTSIEQRVDRLEQMARSEHAWRDEVTTMVRALMQTADRDHVKLRDHDEGIRSFERLGFDLRSDVTNMRAKFDADLKANLDQVPTCVAAYFTGDPSVRLPGAFDKIETELAQLQTRFKLLCEHLDGAANREGIIAMKLQDIEAARPQEGAAIVAAFTRQAHETDAMKTVKDPSQGWTQQKLELLDKIYNSVVDSTSCRSA